MNSTWSKADIHMHTTFSDGTATVREVLEYVVERTDLKVIAITDHDTIEGALEARRLAPQYGIEVIVGAEISTLEGHMLALFIEEPLPRKRPAAESIAAVHEQGGLCIAAHPYGILVPSMGRAGLRERYSGAQREWPLDGVESFNASLWLTSNNDTAAAVGAELGLTLCGGSDSHHLATIGMGYTLFPGQTAEDLRRAIITGQTLVEGSYWGWGRVAEVVGLRFKREMTQLTRRALRPSTP